MALRVVTWNLMHGRSVPPAGRDLLREFAAALSGWRWDVALLQEVPPWWPAALAASLGAEFRLVLTSRNFGLPVRRAIATRRPDLIKSNGGGCNAILVRGGPARGPARGPAILEHRTRRLALWPERRWLHAIRLSDPALWVGNLHCTVHDAEAAIREGGAAGAVLRSWAGGTPAVLGGDFNERGLTLEGFARLAEHDVDYVFAGPGASGTSVEMLERGRLSDHAPVAVTVQFA